MQLLRWTTKLVLFSASITALAQTVTPKLIDVHEHYDGESGMLKKLLVKLTAADGLGILLTTPKGFPQASKFIQEHPDRFIGFGDIKLDDPDVLNEIDRFHMAGFRGLGEITSSQKNYDDRTYWPIYDRAAKYHMILLFHTGIVARPNPEASADITALTGCALHALILLPGAGLKRLSLARTSGIPTTRKRRKSDV